MRIALMRERPRRQQASIVGPGFRFALIGIEERSPEQMLNHSLSCGHECKETLNEMPT